jgi:hypothetical protein
MTFSGMENILHQAVADPEAADALKGAIAAHRPRLSLGDALKGEVAFNVISMTQLRRAGPSLLVRWNSFLELDDEGNEPRRKRQVHALSPKDRRMWLRMLDAAEAAYLDHMRQAIASVEKPHPVRHALYNQLEYLSGRPSITERLFGGVTSLSITGLGENQLRTKAREAVLTAGAALLAHKARRDTFPERLEQILPHPPRDPFSGQPLRYRREGEGFVVYSVGPRGDYDGGQTVEAGEREQVRFRYPAPAPHRPPWMEDPALGSSG